MKKKNVSNFLVLLATPLIVTSCGQTQTIEDENNREKVSPTLHSPSFLDEMKSSLPTLESINESPSDAQEILNETTITEPGNYVSRGNIEGKIKIEVEGVTLYLENCNIENTKKVIDSDYDLTLVVLGENSVRNSNSDGSNAIDCVGDLTILGDGTLNIYSTKNGIKANSISSKDTNIIIESLKDGLHAEVDQYDESDTISPSYNDGGFVYLSDSKVEINSQDDGIQADTFVNIFDSYLDIFTNGGATENITSTSSDLVDGKGIKAGAIDYSSEGLDFEWDGYLINIEESLDNQTIININSNDDAIHSNGDIVLNGGTYTLQTGDDGIHADELVKIDFADIDILKSYEGIEGAKVEIYDGLFDIVSFDDGINGADGTTTQEGVGNPNCQIVIEGGTFNIDCQGSEGDGLDSNGALFIEGGSLFVESSSNGADVALDADGGITINGGDLVAVGSLGMQQKPLETSYQTSVFYGDNSSIKSSSLIELKDSSDETLLTYTTKRQQQALLLTSSKMVVGDVYKLYIDSTLKEEFTLESTVTSLGSQNNQNNRPGNQPPQRP